MDSRRTWGGRYFAPGELGVADGGLAPDSWHRYEALTVHTLDPIRDAIGRPITIISGERRESRAPDSKHMPPSERATDLEVSAAADIQVRTHRGRDRIQPLTLALLIADMAYRGALRVGGIGVYAAGEKTQGFVHVDNRTPRRGVCAVWAQGFGDAAGNARVVAMVRAALREGTT